MVHPSLEWQLVCGAYSVCMLDSCGGFGYWPAAEVLTAPALH